MWLMKLSTWLEMIPGRAAAMAAHFGVSESAINQWKGKVPTRRILAVAAYTSNEVSVEEMLAPCAEPSGSAVAREEVSHG